MTNALMLGRPGTRRTGLWAAACGLLALWACNEIAGPIRPAGYGYTLIASDVVQQTDTIDGVIYVAGDTITDTVDFKWPASSLPLRIWVQDTADLRADMTTAIALWKGELIYGEFDATLVSDSTRADIILRMMIPPASPVPGRTSLAASAGPCEGATDVVISIPDHTRLWTPIRMYVFPNFPLSNPLTAPCLTRVTAHELGHALGLFQHSPDPDDLMYGFPSVDAPSDADVATVLWLYHQPTDLRPRPATDTLPPDSLTAGPRMH